MLRRMSYAEVEWKGLAMKDIDNFVVSSGGLAS
jgi:hypothetical protein